MRKNCLDYPVEIVDNVFAEEKAVLADVLRKVTGSEKPRVMLIADQNVVNHIEGLGTLVGRWVQANGIELAGPPMLVSGGERIKSDECQSALEIVRAALKARIGASDVVLVLGGGTLLDVAGWAVSQVRGGVPLVRMPTTPSAMIDATFADNAALDGAGVKDALRVPCVPAAVVIDPSFSVTVLDGVWRAGFAAAMRQAVALDATCAKKLVRLAQDYRDRDAETFRDVVAAVVAMRMKKGATDFAVWGTHRLEAMSGYKLPHGYAVAIGINIDMAYSVMKGSLTEDDRKLVAEALSVSGAMDGAVHSRHLLGRDELVLLGLDAWRLVNGTGAITILSAIGKSTSEENPDRDTMKRAVNLLK